MRVTPLGVQVYQPIRWSKMVSDRLPIVTSSSSSPTGCSPPSPPPADFDHAVRLSSALLSAWDDGTEDRFLQNLHLADGILVTTDFTARDGRQYAGLPGDKIFRVPMLAPTMAAEVERPEPGSYFVWTTNAAPHKNHLNAIKALETYYARLGGSLQCVITGADTSSIRSSELPHLKEVGQRLKRNRVLADNLLFRGDLPEFQNIALNLCGRRSSGTQGSWTTGHSASSRRLNWAFRLCPPITPPCARWTSNFRWV